MISISPYVCIHVRVFARMYLASIYYNTKNSDPTFQILFYSKTFKCVLRYRYIDLNFCVYKGQN